MLQKLFLKISLLLNNIEIKEVFDDLTSVKQDSFTLAASGSKVFSNVAKVVYIKTSAIIKITLVKGLVTSVVYCTDSCLLTDSYDTVTILNEGTSTVDVYSTVS